MSLEVRELVIRATVVQEGGGTTPAPGSANSDNDVSPNEELITTCVEKILDILKAKHER